MILKPPLKFPPAVLPKQSESRWIRVGGLIALIGYAIHASVHLLRSNPEQLLWACHVADIVVGLGMVFRSRWMTATGTLILLVGLPVWLFGLSAGGEFLPTSLLTHVGGLVIGTAGTVALGGVHRDACKALALIAGLLLVCHLFTGPAANVNLAHRPWFDTTFLAEATALYCAVLLSGWGMALRLAEWLLSNFCQMLNMRCGRG